MPSPADFKLMFKQVVTDPLGLNLPTLPSSAKTSGIAKGTEGNRTGVYGYSERSTGVYGESPVFAGFFQGDVHVNGDLTVEKGHLQVSRLTAQDLAVNANISVRGDVQLTNADVAEDFDIAGPDRVPAGTVMVFGSEGALCESDRAYDKRVAGVISGAGDFKPALVLDKRLPDSNRQPVALMGKVFCRVDAQFGRIEVGDLLTTSATPGHAMKAGDPLQAFGCVIGKALQPLVTGKGLIPILVALQ
jgi:hypothetical protein